MALSVLLQYRHSWICAGPGWLMQGHMHELDMHKVVCNRSLETLLAPGTITLTKWTSRARGGGLYRCAELVTPPPPKEAAGDKGVKEGERDMVKGWWWTEAGRQYISRDRSFPIPPFPHPHTASAVAAWSGTSP